MNQLGTSKSEIIFILALVVGFLLPPAIFGQWWLFGVFLLFFGCFGIVEWQAKKRTGRTVSQHFWEFKRRNPIGAWIIVIGMALAWGALLVHFMAHN